MTESRMGARQDQAAQASVSSIDDLIQDCYRLERAGKMNLALQRGREAEQLARTQGENNLFASALAAQALVHAHLGNYPRSHSLAEEALTCASPNALGRAEANIVLGICSSETDDLDSAESYYHTAADLSREAGHEPTLVRALHDLACGIYYPRGQFDLVVATEQEVLQISQQHGDSLYLAHAWTAIALVHLATGNSTQAEEDLRNLKQLLSSPNSSAILMGYYHCLKGHHHQLVGEAEVAPFSYNQALAIAETAGDPGLNVEVRIGLSRCRRAQGDLPSAYPWADTAVKAAQRSGYHHLEGRALIELGRVDWEMGNWKAAEDNFHRAIQRLQPLKAAFDLSNTRLMLAALAHQFSKEASLSPEALRQSWILAAQGIIDGGYGFLLEQEWRLAFPLIVAYLSDSDPQTFALTSKAMLLLQRSPTPLKITTLGSFEVRQGSHLIPSSGWRRRQAGELFRLLLISPGRRLSREQITEALWPEKSPDAARAFLHQTTSALRRILEPDLPDRFPSRYLFQEEGMTILRLPPGSQVDFEVFLERLHRGDLESALALFKGDPFPFDLYHDWAASQREQLNQQYLEALIHLARQELQENHPQSALESCRLALSIDPWQEQAVLTGMQACLALKDRTGAIRLYRELERCLSDDLGIAPASELSQLYQSLL